MEQVVVRKRIRIRRHVLNCFVSKLGHFALVAQKAHLLK